MECRCYHGGKGRTRMKQLHLTVAVGAVCLVVAVVFVGVLFLYRLPIPW